MSSAEIFSFGVLWYCVVTQARSIWQVGQRSTRIDEYVASHSWPWSWLGGHGVATMALPSAETFFMRHVAARRPAIFRGAASDMPAAKLWLDPNYVASRFGNYSVEVECTLDEADFFKDGPAPSNLSRSERLSDFLKTQRTSHMYATSSLPRVMAQQVFLLPFLNCGGFTRRNVRARLWWSAWPTLSTIHADPYDNVNCFIAGSKRIALWKDTDFSRLEKSARIISVAKVDLKQYPEWDKVEWFDVGANAGDCIFIPVGWHHHFQGTPQMGINVNMFWISPQQFDARSCFRLSERGFDPGHFLSTLRDCAWGYGEDTEEQVEDNDLRIEQRMRSQLPTRCIPRARLPTGAEANTDFFRISGYCDGAGFADYFDKEGLVYRYQPEEDDPEEMLPGGIGEGLTPKEEQHRNKPQVEL